MIDFLTIAVHLSASAVQTTAAYRLFGVYFDRTSADRDKETVLFLLCFFLCLLKMALDLPPLVKAVLTIGMFSALSFLYAGTVLGRLTRALGIVVLMVACEGLVAGLMTFVPTSEHTSWVTGCLLSQLLLLTISLILKRVHTPRISVQISRLYWLAILCLPTGSLMIYFLVIFSFYDPAGNLIFLPVSSVLMLVNLLTFYVLDRLEEYSAAYYEKELLIRQNRAYRAEFDLMRQSEQQISALRHDMKNHLAVLQEYAAQGQMDRLQQYLNTFDQNLTRPGFVHTGNPDIDSILNYKLGQAQQAGARLELDVKLPRGFTADAFNLNVILGNLLDNAVEGLAGSEDKRLFLSMRVDRGVFFLKIVNSYDGVTLRTEEPDGPVYRSRKGGPDHGLGLAIVRRIVNKCHGELHVDSTGTLFTVEAILYLDQ